MGKICVYGLWHLGCVTAACLAEQGHTVVGLDQDVARVTDLKRGHPPIAEPGLPELLSAGLEKGNLAFTSDPGEALATADTLWVTFDTPVDESDRADVGWIRAQLDVVRQWVRPDTLIVISSQVPVGFGRTLCSDWSGREASLQFISSPENLRLGQALESFRSPARVVVGVSRDTDRDRVARLFGPLQDRIVWMSLESAEMTKHALNAFLATSVAYTNEVARLCEVVGASASEVEEGLRSDPRIGARAYVSAGPAIAGGTLPRDVRYLMELGARQHMATPLLDGVLTSNTLHLGWMRNHLSDLIRDISEPRVALLGLTYKVGTDTLRRSSALELAHWLHESGVQVAAYDPAVRTLPADIAWVRLERATEDALIGADAVVVATPWPEFGTVNADLLARAMRRVQVIDQSGYLRHLASDPRVRYVRLGHGQYRAAE